PDMFTPDMPIELMCCKEADAKTRAKGVDLALVLATGAGPMVLSQSAWARVVASMGTAPAMTPNDLWIATWPTAIQANWSAIPRFAIVDNETGSATDPGPCVELGRARRIEQVS